MHVSFFFNVDIVHHAFICLCLINNWWLFFFDKTFQMRHDTEKKICRYFRHIATFEIYYLMQWHSYISKCALSVQIFFLWGSCKNTKATNQRWADKRVVPVANPSSWLPFCYRKKKPGNAKMYILCFCFLDMFVWLDFCA